MKRAIILPGILLVYLIVMVVLGWPGYISGATSGLLYFGGTVLCLGCIAGLHFNLRRAACKKANNRKQA